MGAGKTTVGRILSELLSVPFFDTDSIIEERHGPIDKIFRKKGEPHFRKIEEDVIGELFSKDGDFVAALGGGAPLSEKTRRILREKSVPVYLACDTKTAYARVKETNRPLAKDFKSFNALFLKRKKIYESFPFAVSSEKNGAREIAVLVKDFLRKEEFSGFQKIEISPAPISETKRSAPEFYITDRNVYSLYETLFAGKKGISLPPGERSKTLGTVKRIYSALLSFGITRKDAVFYAGGGVVGDIAGFTSATLLRGVPLVAFPTTLLAMTDSAIGGKNGVNLPEGKNLAGTFYLPKLTFVNPVFLWTLPKEEVLNGAGEVFKYALLSKNGLFGILERHGIGAFKSLEVKKIIEKSIREKLKFVKGDFHDTKGKRAFLNLGHTVGHAIEKLSGFSVGHGEAVAFGIVVSAFYSMRAKKLKEKEFQRICALYGKLGFKMPKKKFKKEEFAKTVYFDKKREKSKIRWIVPVRHNACEAAFVSPEEIANAYKEVADENPCD